MGTIPERYSIERPNIKRTKTVIWHQTWSEMILNCLIIAGLQLIDCRTDAWKSNNASKHAMQKGNYQFNDVSVSVINGCWCTTMERYAKKLARQLIHFGGNDTCCGWWTGFFPLQLFTCPSVNWSGSFLIGNWSTIVPWMTNALLDIGLFLDEIFEISS